MRLQRLTGAGAAEDHSGRVQRHLVEAHRRAQGHPCRPRQLVLNYHQGRARQRFARHLRRRPPHRDCSSHGTEPSLLLEDLIAAGGYGHHHQLTTATSSAPGACDSYRAAETAAAAKGARACKHEATKTSSSIFLRRESTHAYIHAFSPTRRPLSTWLQGATRVPQVGAAVPRAGKAIVNLLEPLQRRGERVDQLTCNDA